MSRVGQISNSGQSREVPHPVRIYRHPLPVRLFHWVNAVCCVILLMSGLQIFNNYPRLHWGHTGYAAMPALFEIWGTGKMEDPRSWVQIGSHRFDTTGILGAPAQVPGLGSMPLAFPWWMTLPFGIGELGYGRGWHFLAAWLLFFNLAWYWLFLLIGKRFWTELVPTAAQLRPRAILKDLWQHLRLHRSSGSSAARYNLLQRLSYVFVLGILLPAQILSGMTISNSAVAIFPWLIDLFGGRQSARVVHFCIAMALTLFLLVHLFQVFVAGFVQQMRAMITGWLTLRSDIDGR